MVIKLKRKHLLGHRFVVMVMILVCYTGYGQTKNITSRENKSLHNTLDSIFSSFNKTTPGVAVTILQNGKVTAKKAYGLASLEHNVPFTHNTVVRLPYSEGREFISIAAVLMEKEGLLRLDDKVRKYFPRLPAWSEPVTLEDLIHHRSGFADEWDALLLMMARMSNRFDVSQFLNLLYRQPKPEVEPGKGYMYSNSDYGLLRLIMEKAAGENLREWMKKKMFVPLGMTSTLLHDNANETIPGYALRYSGADDKFSSITDDKTSPGGNYYIATTATDLEKWAAAHSDNKSSISKAVQRLLLNPQNMPGAERNYTFGIKIRNDDGNLLVLHQGVNKFTYLTEVPEMGMSIITLGNYWIEYEPYHKNIWQTLLKIPADKPVENKIFKRAAVSYSPQQWEKITGRYYSADTVSFESNVSVHKKTISFILQNDTLKGIDGGFILPLISFSPFIFKNPYAETYFEFSPQGEDLKIHAPSVNKLYHFLKNHIPLWKPSRETLAGFTGKYYSSHLDYYWTLELNDEGNIVLKRPTIADTVLEPEITNQFILKIETFYAGQSDDGRVLFHKDANGNFTHFTVWHPRLMHHRFDKVEVKFIK